MNREQLSNAAAIAVVLLVCGWFASGGTGRLLGEESHGRFYDAQARSLLAGRWDVPCDAIGSEAFVVAGRCYGYFGPTPALLRLPVLALLPGRDGQWSRVSVLVAIALVLGCAVFLVARARALVPANGAGPASQAGKLGKAGQASQAAAGAFFLLLVGLGSTPVTLTSPPFVFHEAIAWASALCLLSLCALLRFLETGSRPGLGVSLVAALLCANTRATTGLGPALALGAALAHGLWQRRAAPAPRHPSAASLARLALLAAGALATLASPLLVSYYKFGIWGTPPLAYHIQFASNPARLERSGGHMVQPRNLLFNARHYLAPLRLQPAAELPWFRLGEELPAPDAWLAPRVDSVEPTASLPDASPALVLLAGLGGWACLRRRELAAFRAPLLGALVPGASVLGVAYVSHRYAQEFHPFLVISGALGLRWLLTRPRGRARTAALALLGAAGLASVYVSVFAAFLQPNARGDVKDALLALQLRVHGTPARVVPAPGARPLFETGVHRAPAARTFRLERGRGFLPEPGQQLVFAHSGLRRVTEVRHTETATYVTVDGPLDPVRDGHPHPVEIGPTSGL